MGTNWRAFVRNLDSKADFSLISSAFLPGYSLSAQTSARPTEAAEPSRGSRQEAACKFTYCRDDDGALVLKARLPAGTGTLVLRAVEAAESRVALPGPDVSAETSQSEQSPRAARRADALGLIAESFLAHGAEALHGGGRMGHGLAIEVLLQRAARARTLPRKRAMTPDPAEIESTARLLPPNSGG